MPALARWRGDVVALALLLVAVLAFFWDVLVGPRVLLPADVLYDVPPWSGLPEASQNPIPHNGLIADAILQNVAWKSFARATLADGELPLWNPYEYAGMPFLAGGQSGSIYPLGVLFYLLPVARAYGPFLALHVFLGGAFSYAFARALGCRPAASLIGGLGFAFSAFLIVSFTWPMIVSAAIWLPLLLLAVEIIVRGGEAGRGLTWQLAVGLAGAAVLGLEILAGHLEITFYTAFCLLFYAVGRLIAGPLSGRGPQASLNGFAALATMGLLGPALAAVQLLPFYELIGQNFRSGFVDLPTVLSYALPRWQVATFFIPDFFGNPSHHGYFSLLTGAWKAAGPNALGQPTDPPGTVWWGWPKNYVEAASYVGLLSLLLALLALVRVRTRQVAVLALLGALALALAFGSPLYAFFFFGVPGVDQLHTPFRWIYPYTVVITTLAALGAESLARAAPAWARRAAVAVGAAGALGLAGCALIAIRPASFVAVAQRVLERSGRLQRAFADGDALLSYEWRNLALFALFLGLSGLAVWLVAREPRRGLAFAAAVLAADLFVAHAGFNTRANPTPLQVAARCEPSRREEPLRQDGVSPCALPALASLRADSEPFRVVGFADDAALTPITGMLAGIEDVRGYDTVVPRRYVEYWSLIEPPSGLEYSKMLGLTRVESLASPLLRLLNVRYVVSSRSIDSPQLELVRDDGMRVYRLRDPLPRAFVVGQATVVPDDRDAFERLQAPGFDPRREVVLTGCESLSLRDAAPPGISAVGACAGPGTGGGNSALPESTQVQPATGQARFLERSPNRLRLRAELERPGYLVVTDFDFPGWRAQIDGQPAPVLRADHIFRAVALPAGVHEVELRYSPESLRLGGAISALAALALMVGLGGLGARQLLSLRSSEGAVRRVARNALSGMGTSLLNKAIDFAFAIAMLRLLHADGIGRYTFAIAISGYLEILSNFGLNALVIREGAQRPDGLGRIGGSSLLLRLALWLCGAPLIAAMLGSWRATVGLPEETLAATALLCLALVPGNVAATYSSLFYARERVEVPTLLTVATTIAKISLGLLVLLLGYGIVGLAGVALLGNVGTAVTLAFLARQLGVCRRLEFSRVEARAMIAPAFPLMLNHLLATLFFKVDVLLLQPIRGDRELGYYATAYKFVDGLGIIPSAFTFAVFPLLSRLATGADADMRRAYALSLKLLVFVSVPIALGFTAAAYPLVRLVGGVDYLPDAAIALQLLIWFLPLSFANGLTQYALVAAGRQRAITLAFVVAVVFNVAANLVGIPRFGYRAAAVVTVLSELALAIPFAFVVARTIGVSLVQLLAPFLVAGLAALAAFLALEPLAGGVGALGAGLAVYGLALLALRPLDAPERDGVRRAARALLPGAAR